MTLLSELQKKQVNIQILMNLCKHQLASNQDVIRESVPLIATTAQVVLDPQNTDNTVFCIQRQGDPEPQTILLRVHTTESIRKGELMIWIDVLICSIGILFAAYVIYRKRRLRPQVFRQ
ncbi:hypothetical protein FGIG_08423 [Fasciola gigantica]|uniref:Uncharacterized protein n=1 Tax=Fasciola gigantica TaxID=46835 RepID=A0A504Y8V6_FASGI|nr:hypothetical protein FGIG_08423 [Fasciola gigantica]